MEYIIYKITCDSPDVQSLYVGSTKHFKNRKHGHMMKSKDEKCTFKLYNTIREHGGFSNWTMEIIEFFTCNTFLEARIRERFFCEELRADLNIYRPQVSQQESYEIIQQHYEDQSHKVHCDACNCEIRKSNMPRHVKSKTHLNNLQIENTASKNDL